MYAKRVSAKVKLVQNCIFLEALISDAAAAAPHKGDKLFIEGQEFQFLAFTTDIYDFRAGDLGRKQLK